VTCARRDDGVMARLSETRICETSKQKTIDKKHVGLFRVYAQMNGIIGEAWRWEIKLWRCINEKEKAHLFGQGWRTKGKRRVGGGDGEQRRAHSDTQTASDSRRRGTHIEANKQQEGRQAKREVDADDVT
jgi:hypothetical protein